MSNARLTRHLLRSTIMVAAATLAAPALAQDGDVDDITPTVGEDSGIASGADIGDTIVVTGSRLNQANLRGPSPVTAIGGEEIDIRGTTNVEELVNILPQALAGQTSDVANGATGTSNLDLRGLGAVRTLTLIDGKRLPFGSISSSAVNLDLIPAQLVERIEITTGGESAVYGSDAVAGVANFILRRDFEGFEFDIQGGYFHDDNDNEFAQSVLRASGNNPSSNSAQDGEEITISGLIGANTGDGRGNVTAFASYSNQTAISQGDRDISGCALGGSSGPTSVDGIACVGSFTFRSFLNGAGDDVFQEADGTLVPLVGGSAQTFNFGPTNFFRRPTERFNLYTSARYELDDNVEAFADLSFANTNTDAQIAFSGSFFRPFTVNCDNPFLDNGLGPDGDGVATFSNLQGCDGAFGVRDGDDVADERDDFQDELDALGIVDPDLLDPDDEDDARLLGEFNRLTGEIASLNGLLPNADGSDPDEVPLQFGYRNVTGDPRNSEIDNSTWRLVGGFRGNVDDLFDWEVFGQYSRTRTNDISTGDLNGGDLQNALNVVTDDDGNPVCASGDGDGCVPLNIFGRTPSGGSLVTPAAAAYIQGNGFTTGTTEQVVIGGFTRTDLTDRGISSPLAESGIQGLLGFEYREDRLERQPDDISQLSGAQGGLTGVGGGTLPIDGEIQVFELFAEVSVPLIEDAPGFEQLVVDAAYRYSDYDNEGSDPAGGIGRVETGYDADTYRAGVRWVPIPDLTLRGQYQRAVRAPNVFDLFIGLNTGLFNLPAGANGLFDPCASGTDGDGNVIEPAATAAQCANTGVTAAQFGNVRDNAAGQFNNVTGGNPNLTPEVADTYTIGAIWEPTFVDGLSISVDYFDITVEDAIASIPAQTSLTQCLETGASQFCDLIVRDSAGTLFLDNSNFEGIQQTQQNIAEISTSGFDLAVRYDYDLGAAGSVDFNYVATVLDNWDFIPLPGEDAVSCERKYGGQCGQPYAEYVHRFLAGYRTPFDLDVTGTWRYTSAVGLEGNQGNDLDDELEDRHYFDVAANYQLNEGLNLRAGVNNVFDRDPPLTTSGSGTIGNGNTYPGYYNSVGRFIFVGANLSF